MDHTFIFEVFISCTLSVYRLCEKALKNVSAKKVFSSIYISTDLNTFLQKAMTKPDSVDDRSGEGDAYGNLGIAYDNMGNFQKAIEYHKKLLKIAKEVGDRSG